MVEHRLSSGSEVLFRLAGITAGLAILVVALGSSLLAGAAAVTVDSGEGPRALAIIAAWDAALVAAFLYGLYGRRGQAGATAFALLALLPLIIASNSNG